MKQFQSFQDGGVTDVLICFTDIDSFTKISKDKLPVDLAKVLKGFASITADHIRNSAGHIVKYMGDTSLIIFPEDSVDDGVLTLLHLKQAIEKYFSDIKSPTVMTFTLHFGEIVFIKLEPFETLDIIGDAVHIAFSLDRGPYRGKFAITPQVFRKLQPETRKRFHKYTPPIVYLSE